MNQVLMDSSYDFEKICRTCLLEAEPKYQIFENSLSEIITACASVNISYNDGLPENLCGNCYEKIGAFYKFKQLCEESNTKLHEIKNNLMLPSNENANLIKHEHNSDLETKIEFPERIRFKQDVNQPNQTKYDNRKLNQKLNYNKEDCYVNYNENTYKCRIKTNGISYLCSICSDIFNTKQLLKKHIVEHLKSKIYFCDECGKGFVEAHSLTKHMRRHATTHNKTNEKKVPDKRHVCSICGQSFGGRFHLNMHMRTHAMKKSHMINIRQNKSEKLLPPYDCTRCNKTFKSKLNLLQHIRRHNGEKPYVCAACGKAFVTSSELRSHDRKHTGIKSKHVCEICGKDFAAPNALEIHMRKHTGERPFSCEECGRSYKEIGTLRKHTRIIHKQHGYKQHICEICGRETISPSALVIHIRTHTGERPFLCAECGHGFISQGRLNKHKKSHKDVFL